MEVICSVDYVELENDNGRKIDSVEVTCSRCDHSTQSYGDSAGSVRRCLVLLREECPNEEKNFYVTENDEDQD